MMMIVLMMIITTVDSDPGVCVCSFHLVCFLSIPLAAVRRSFSRLIFFFFFTIITRERRRQEEYAHTTICLLSSTTTTTWRPSYETKSDQHYYLPHSNKLIEKNKRESSIKATTSSSTEVQLKV